MAAPLDLEQQLNPQQLEAVTHGEGPQLVLAGAGSGKTRVITYRVAWLVEERGVPPEGIVAVTFTNKAAAEMRERVEELLGLYPLPTFLGTFHRYALLLLRRYGERVGLKRDFTILDSDDQIALVKRVLSAEGLSDSAFPPRAVLSAISGAKNRLLGPDAYEAQATDFFRRKVAPVYRRYQGMLREIPAVDFDDMITLAVRLMEREEEVASRLRRDLHHLLVDEYQDTNHAQVRLIRALLGDNHNITAVGDEDQGIYRWRGAEIDNILRFEEHFPEAVVRKLERNYRSTQTILDAASAVVAHNENRRGKRLWTDAGDGDTIELYRAADERDEAKWVVAALKGFEDEHPFSEMGILVRTNAQTRSLEDELIQQGVPYILVGGVRFYERAEIKDLVAYLRVLRNPRDNYSLSRVINQPPRGIGKATQEMLRQRAEELGQPQWDVLALDEFGTFPARAAKALASFRDLLQDLHRLAGDLPLPALLHQLLEATGYADLYKKDNPEDEARLENIREFLSAAQEFTESNAYRGDTDDVLTAFLDHASLTSDIDSWQNNQGVSVMTLHSAKGLEFPVVVIAGLEDGLLPHFNAQGTRDDVEEERRLLYVGMTRAKRRLLLTTCRRRRVAGRYQDREESPFLAEIPGELLTITNSSELFADSRSDGVYSFFGRGRSSPSSSTSPSYTPRAEPYPRRAAAHPGDLGTATPDGIRQGSRVRHPTLGSGVVLETEGGGDSMKMVVFFDRAGKKKLIAKYAGLELL